MPRDLAITFAGGGNRAFYQLGLMNRWKERLLPRTAAVVSCSAGACVITMVLAGRAEEAGVFWRARREGITRNFDWRRVLRGERLAPHGEIYRDTLVHTFADGGFERVRAQPFPILVLAAAFPTLLPTAVAVALGISVYSLERALRGRVHPEWTRRLGFAPVLVDARECRDAEELTALILASSATPPFTPLGRFRGQALLDGGMVDNVPAFAADDLPGVRQNLVLLTRPYDPALLGRHGNRLYVAPTVPPPISRWDYTAPDLLQATIEMGEREAEGKWGEVERFLGDEGRETSSGPA